MNYEVAQNFVGFGLMILIIALIFSPIFLCDLSRDTPDEITLVEGIVVHTENNQVYIVIDDTRQTKTYWMNTREVKIYDRIRATCIGDSITTYEILGE